MKRRTILLLSVLVLAGAAMIYFRSGDKVQAVSFVTSKAQYGHIAKSITATGTLQPLDTVSVGAQVSGVIKTVYVDFNSTVSHGQLLAKVEPSIIAAQVEQSKANLANAQSNLQYQQNNFDRQKQLYDLGAISKADYQVALNQYNSSRAAVANAAAQLKLAEKNLYYTDIYSPINGVVLNRNVSAGQTIASSFNAPTLFVIAKDLTKMQVRAAVDEADIGGVRPGQHATFTVDAFPDDVFEGSVQDILLHPSVSANVVTYTTLINVDNKAMKLKPGMTASINIYTEENNHALLIPSRALSFKPDSAILKHYIIKKAERRGAGGAAGVDKGMSARQSPFGNNGNLGSAGLEKSYVWIKTGDSLVQKRIVTGMTDDVNVMVVKGLSPGDEVITNVVSGGPKAKADAQRSPFMPQMPRRTTAPRNR